MSTTAVQANSSWSALIYHEFQNEFAFSFYFCQVACPAHGPFSYLFSSFEISCEIFVLYKQFWKGKKVLMTSDNNYMVNTIILICNTGKWQISETIDMTHFSASLTFALFCFSGIEVAALDVTVSAKP